MCRSRICWIISVLELSLNLFLKINQSIRYDLHNLTVNNEGNGWFYHKKWFFFTYFHVSLILFLAHVECSNTAEPFLTSRGTGEKSENNWVDKFDQVQNCILLNYASHTLLIDWFEKKRFKDSSKTEIIQHILDRHISYLLPDIKAKLSFVLFYCWQF